MGTPTGFTGKLAFAIAAGVIGSAFQHGYNTGVINNPQKILEQWMNVTLHNRGENETAVISQGTITILWSTCVAIYCIGGMIGGAITGIVANGLGRRGGLLWNNVLVFAGAACETFSKPLKSIELIIIGRLLIGINSGLNAGLSPMYLSEISPINLRGAIGSAYQLVITISILLAQIVSINSLLGTEELWPWLFALSVVPALFQVLTLPCCPESPKYLLVTKNDDQRAKQSLVWLRGTDNVQNEMSAMKGEADALKLLPKVTVREMITNNALRIPLIIAMMVMLAQQLSGINAVMFFSTYIFNMAGLEGNSSVYATMGVGVVNVLMTVVSLYLVERAGRKTLLVIGFGGLTVTTAILGICFLFADKVKFLSYICILLVFIYIIMFASGPGSIPWFLVSEIFNQAARPTATSLAVCVNWTANFLVGLAFLPLAELMGRSVFFIFVGLDIIFFIFIIKKVPETRNKTIEEISAMFRQQSYQ